MAIVIIFLKTLVFSEYHASFPTSFEIFCCKIEDIFCFFLMCILRMIMSGDVFSTE